MNPYKILGVTKDASDEEIKAAYRKLARIYHPDSASLEQDPTDAAEYMRQINEAYEIIRTIRKTGQEETFDPENWDPSAFSYEREGAPEEYHRSPFSVFGNPVFRRVVLLVMIISMVGMTVWTALLSGMAH